MEIQSRNVSHQDAKLLELPALLQNFKTCYDFNLTFVKHRHPKHLGQINDCSDSTKKKENQVAIPQQLHYIGEEMSPELLACVESLMQNITSPMLPQKKTLNLIYDTNLYIPLKNHVGVNKT